MVTVTESAHCDSLFGQFCREWSPQNGSIFLIVEAKIKVSDLATANHEIQAHFKESNTPETRIYLQLKSVLVVQLELSTDL